MDVGYEPSRVIQLSRRAAEAINSLAGLASTDPAAAEAIRTIRLTRSNLEDHWMPALRDIEGSDAMVRWRSSRLSTFGFGSLGTLGNSFPDHLRPGVAPAPIPPEVRSDLLRRLDLLERKSVAGTNELGAGVDPVSAPTKAELRALGNDLAHWVARDDRFADELARLSTSNMMIGQLLGAATFPSSFASSVVRHMAEPNGPDTDVDRDRYAESLGTALASLTDDPGACLDLLMEDGLSVLFALGRWEHLDQRIVTEFMVAGLHEAVEDEPTRLGDGYRVLQHLTVLANGPFDRRISPGVALGFATSMVTYLDTMSLALGYSSDSSQFTVSDRPRGISAPFGDYADMTGLFGVMLRHEEARAVLGGVTADWAASTLRGSTSEESFTSHLTAAADFTQLLIASGIAEQEQMEREAAEEEAGKRRVGDFLGFVVDGVLQVKRVPASVRRAVGYAIDLGTNWIAKTDSEVMPGRPWGLEIHQQIVITTIAMSIDQRDFFHDEKDRSLTPTQRQEVEADLALIDRTLDPALRETRVNAMISNIEGYVPALEPALNAIDNNTAANDLTR